MKHELTAIRSNIVKDDGEVRSIHLAPILALTLVKAISPTTAAAAKLAAELSLNKHFYIPRAVSSMFTGKTDLLDDLRHTLFDMSEHVEKRHVQKRFIIYGLAGSGKTEFCCKFAQDNRQR